ncbi:hypothetical protein M569_14606 [Genlisea aurea]|uniref:WRKY domain-containing protein n=1 Tax=Genlisea aurea TaxID=192259 RepID=S8DBT2_9LAMI|nr:hypothetical protein M569_14606 [Genlisea aurea]
MSINKQQRKARSSGELDDVEYSPEDNNGARDVRINSASLSKRSGKGGIHRRVVSVPVPLKEMDGGRLKGDQSSAPPSDSWAWRKYGQKPIKGSPYPRYVSVDQLINV